MFIDVIARAYIRKGMQCVGTIKDIYFLTNKRYIKGVKELLSCQSGIQKLTNKVNRTFQELSWSS